MSNYTTQLMTVTEVGSELSLGPSTIWRKVKNGQFPQPIKVGGATRWHQSEIEAYVAKLTNEQRNSGGEGKR